MAKDDIIVSVRDQAQQVRAKCPSAYALTVNEAIRVGRIDLLIWQFFNSHTEFMKADISEEEIAAGKHPKYSRVFDDTSVSLIREIFDRRRISLTNAKTLADRVLSGHTFEIVSMLRLNTEEPVLSGIIKDGIYQGIISREEFPAFYDVYEAEDINNAQALREALGLSGEYLMLCPGEEETLRLIKIVAEYTSQPVTVVQQHEGYITIKSTPQSTALVSVGGDAIRNARYDDINEHFSMITATGQNLFIRGKALTSSERVSIDKLLRQINSKSLMNNCQDQKVEITLDEFMELRGLRDRKEARKQFNKAIDLLYNVSYELDDGKHKISVRYLQIKATIDNSRAVFLLSDPFFKQLRDNGSIDYSPKGFLRMDGKSDNAYAVGMYLSDQRRRNIGKGDSYRVSIGKLLEVTDLPSASGIDSKYYRRQIIVPFFNALNKAASEGNFEYRIVHSRGDTLTAEEKNNIMYDYSIFISCLIEPTWHDEPDYHKELRQRKQTEAEARERGRLKGIESAAKKQAEEKILGKPIKKR